MNIWQYLHWQFDDTIVPVIRFFTPDPWEVLALIPRWGCVPIMLCGVAIVFFLLWMIDEHVRFVRRK